MIAKLSYVTCDRCGTPGTDAVKDSREARKLLPKSWSRIGNQDICPQCLADQKGTEQ